MTDMIELPDGRLLCAAHQLTICGKCCVDYSFMAEVLDDEEGKKEESDGDELLTEEEMKRLVAAKGETSYSLPFSLSWYLALTGIRMWVCFAVTRIWMQEL